MIKSQHMDVTVIIKIGCLSGDSYELNDAFNLYVTPTTKTIGQCNCVEVDGNITDVNV